jgi:hypothetical protein
MPESPSAAAVRARLTPGFTLERACAAAAVALALWVLGSTILLIRTGYSPLPNWDAWDDWREYLARGYSWTWFFQQHGDHRIALPRLLFAVDHLAFGARQVFLLLAICCLQALEALMLWRGGACGVSKGRSDRVVLGAAILCCLFSAQQQVNFVWGFQVGFMLVFCTATAAVFALWKAHERCRDGGPGGYWLAIACLLAAASTYSMANGLLLWPVLVAFCCWLRLPRRYRVTLATGTVLFFVLYFSGYEPVGSPTHAAGFARHLGGVVIFALAHLGSPLEPLASLLSHGDTFRLACAAIAGAVLLAAVAAGLWRLWRRRDTMLPAQAVLLHLAGFLAISSGMMAIGRSPGSLLAAFTSRYLTPAYLFWIALLLAAWPLWRRLPRAALYAAVAAALFAGVAIHQRRVLQEVRTWAGLVREGETAIVADVWDPDTCRYIFHTPQLAFASMDYLRAHHLSTFREDWTGWAGTSLSPRFTIDASRACLGSVDEVKPVLSSEKPGWRFAGIAWDKSSGRAPRFILLADENNRIAGVARTGPGAGAPAPAAWAGYAKGHAKAITAYVVEHDGKSLCALGPAAVDVLR